MAFVLHFIEPYDLTVLSALRDPLVQPGNVIDPIGFLKLFGGQRQYWSGRG